MAFLLPRKKQFLIIELALWAKIIIDRAISPRCVEFFQGMEFSGVEGDGFAEAVNEEDWLGRFDLVGIVGLAGVVGFA